MSEDFSLRSSEFHDQYPVARPRKSKSQKGRAEQPVEINSARDEARNDDQRWTILHAKPMKRDTQSLPSDVILEDTVVN